MLKIKVIHLALNVGDKMKLTKRKDGRWQYNYSLGDGKKVKAFYSSEPSEKKAEKEIIQKIASYQTSKDKGITINQALDLWQDSERYQKLAYQTSHRYESLAKHIIDYFDGRRVKGITPKDVNAFIKSLINKGYSGKSVKDNKSVLKMILDAAIVHGDIAENPAASIRIEKGLPKTIREIPKKEEIQIILDNSNCPMGRLAKFLLYTGLRLGEALALTYEDIDFENRSINICKSVYFLGNEPYVKTPKTINGYRTVFLLDPIYDDYEQCKNKTGLIFCNESGNLLRKHRYVKPWNRWMESMGIHITAHQLRHAYASYILYDSNIDVKTAQKLLGHADVETTMNIYTHLTNMRLNSGFKQINNHVSKNPFGCQNVVKIDTMQ